MVIREYCSVTGRLGSVKIYNSRSEYPFVRKVRMRGEEGGVKEFQKACLHQSIPKMINIVNDISDKFS